MKNILLISEQQLRKLLKEELTSTLEQGGVLSRQELADTYLNAEQAASFLKLAKATLYGLVHRRKIPFIKQGRRLLFERTALKHWLSGDALKQA